jgi:hypothetical protein
MKRGNHRKGKPWSLEGVGTNRAGKGLERNRKKGEKAMRKTGGLILVFLMLLIIAGCKGEEKRPAQEKQSELASASDQGALNQGAENSPDSQNRAAGTGKPRILFDQKDFDFGEAEAGQNIEHVFKFRNTGDGTLVINNVRSG